MKCFEHFPEPSPNELAAFKLKGIGIFISNITAITLTKFGKRARGCCVHVFLDMWYIVVTADGLNLNAPV